MSKLFSPLELRRVRFKNRIFVSPMCQYSSVDGVPTDWHFVHLGSRAVGGAGLVMVEATAVCPEGRITPWDSGIWADEQGRAFERTIAFMQGFDCVAGIQLAHAGRKASTDAPWRGGRPLAADAGGWQPLAPSPIAFAEEHPAPHAMSAADIDAVTDAFAASAARSRAAGFEVLEIHMAHGYLLHEFLSPLSNRRTDEYGGTFENRVRLALRVTRAVRDTWPERLPLFARISCTDWVDGGWDLAQSIALCRMLKELGVDLIDCSSGGLVSVRQDSGRPRLPGAVCRCDPQRGRHSHRCGRPDHPPDAGRTDRAHPAGGRGFPRPRAAARPILAVARGRNPARGHSLAGTVRTGPNHLTLQRWSDHPGMEKRCRDHPGGLRKMRGSRRMRRRLPVFGL